MNYRFDLAPITIGDMAEIARAGQANDIYALIEVANRYISINLLALPMAEMSIVMQDFAQALGDFVKLPPDPIDLLIQRALEIRS